MPRLLTSIFLIPGSLIGKILSTPTVPEIFLTPQIYESLNKAFKGSIEIFHSGLPDLQRYKVWLDASSDSPKVYVGTRSAVFLPNTNLGLVIFDEEHDQSYKQHEGLRYDSKKIIKLIYEKSTKLLLSSATPSLQNLSDTTYNDIKGNVVYYDRAAGRYHVQLRLLNKIVKVKREKCKLL